MLWLFTFALLAQDPVNSTITVESSVELETVVQDGKGESKRQLTLNRKEKFKQTKVDAKTVKIEVLASTLQKSGSDTPLEEKATPLAGQSYVSSKTETGWVPADADGGSPPSDGRSLGAWNNLGTLLPAGGDPKSGDKWTVESKDVLALIFPTAIREATGKLECVCESADGGKAIVTFSGVISGKGKDDSQAEIKLEIKSGRLTYDLGKKAFVVMLMSGGFSSKMDIVDVLRRPGTGLNVNNDEERRKIGEINVNSLKLELALTFE
jgi:hypothetical protein